MEFFSEAELTKELGDRRAWGRAILKELLDNSLDACESAGTPPIITVTADEVAHTLTVQDNGPGLPVAVLEKSLDYTVRVSDKTYYCSPSRGQQGHALKCLWPLPFVLGGQRQPGRVDVATGGVRYDIRVSVDALAQTPRVTLTAVPAPEVKSGTAVTIYWPRTASYQYGVPDAHCYFSGAQALVQRYALFNPHCSLASMSGEASVEYPASDPTWSKWTPKAPTSPHWYTPSQFRDLVGAFLHADRQTEAGARLLSTFLAEFDGFSGSAAQGDVLRALGLRRATLEALVAEGAIDQVLADQLLQAMQGRARPVAPKRLGVLGEAHLRAALTTRYDVDPETLHYRSATGTTDGLPYVLEAACGWARDPGAGHTLRCGVNFAPALDVPWRHLYWWCDEADLGADDPVTLVVHVTGPGLQATDRSKREVALPAEMEDALQALVLKVAEPWTKLKAKVRREGKHLALQEERERRQHRPMSVKEAAWQVMEAAYMKASNQGSLPANARQIMYSARPDIIRLTGKAQPWKHSSYFTQHLLPDFIAAHPDLTADWDVIYDARGHFREPHTGYAFGVGTGFAPKVRSAR
jgi:DNA topoisomerase VI subunit B